MSLSPPIRRAGLVALVLLAGVAVVLLAGGDEDADSRAALPPAKVADDVELRGFDSSGDLPKLAASPEAPQVSVTGTPTAEVAPDSGATSTTPAPASPTPAPTTPEAPTADTDGSSGSDSTAPSEPVEQTGVN